jgi:hypothetical protein
MKSLPWSGSISPRLRDLRVELDCCGRGFPGEDWGGSDWGYFRRGEGVRVGSEVGAAAGAEDARVFVGLLSPDFFYGPKRY